MQDLDSDWDVSYNKYTKHALDGSEALRSSKPCWKFKNASPKTQTRKFILVFLWCCNMVSVRTISLFLIQTRVLTDYDGHTQAIWF